MELEHSDSSAPSQTIGFSERMYSGGSEAQIGFDDGGYNYLIFDRSVRTNFSASGRHDGEVSTGLEILRGARRIARWSCRSRDAAIDYQYVGDHLPIRAFVEH